MKFMKPFWDKFFPNGKPAVERTILNAIYICNTCGCNIYELKKKYQGNLKEFTMVNCHHFKKKHPKADTPEEGQVVTCPKCTSYNTSLEIIYQEDN